MRKVLDKIMRVLAAVTFAFMFILVIWQVFTRYVLNNSATWTEELTSYLFARSTLFGAALVTGERDHMNIPIVIEKKSPKAQKIAAIFSECIVIAFSIIVLVYGGTSITKLAMGQMTSSLGRPIGVFYVALPVAGVINVLYCILNIRDINQGKVTFTQAKSAAEASEKMANASSDVSKHEKGEN